MKALVTKKLVLSIGLIVKNEEKHLDACLKALMPLLKAIEGELIIADTGSSDHTVEIAHQYTDHVFSFVWCDDFAAARNAVLERAHGTWFMYIDADEVMDEDLSDMIRFFKNDTSQYNSASYIVRSYTDKKREQYSDFNAYRIFRRRPEMYFEGKIHEGPIQFPPIKRLNTVADHSGYIDLTHNSAKNARNMVLMEELWSKDPTSPRLCSLMADALTASHKRSDQLKCEEILLTGIEAVEREEKDTLTWELFRGPIYLRLARLYEASNQRSKSRKIIQDYFNGKDAESAIDIEMYLLKGLLCFKTDDFSGALENFGFYCTLRERFLAGELTSREVFAIGFNNIDAKDYDRVRSNMVWCHIALEQREEAARLLDKIRPTEAMSEQGELYLLRYEFLYARELKDGTRLPYVYEKVLQTHNEKHIHYFFDRFEDCFIEMTPFKKELSASLCADGHGDAFRALCFLRSHDGRPDASDLEAVFDCLEQEEEVFKNEHYADVYYYALLYLENPERFFDRLSPEKMGLVCGRIMAVWDDGPRKVLDYVSSGMAEAQSMPRLLWQIRLLESAIVKRGDLSEDERLLLLKTFVEQAALFYGNMYMPELFSDENITLLPSSQQFVYHLSTAFQADKEGKYPEYLRNLRKALTAYEVMKKPVEVLVERFEAEQEKRDADAQEFRKLSTAIKAQVNAFLAKGMKNEAETILQQYRTINPTDPELELLTRRIMSI